MQKKAISALESVFVLAHEEEVKEKSTTKKADASLATSLTPSTADAMANCLLHLASETENRGLMVQQRGALLLRQRPMM